MSWIATASFVEERPRPKTVGTRPSLMGNPWAAAGANRLGAWHSVEFLGTAGAGWCVPRQGVNQFLGGVAG